jgi:hypothetical protein
MFPARPLSCLVRKFVGALSHVALISAREGVITAHVLQLLQHLVSGFPNLQVEVMCKLNCFLLLLVKMHCSQLGIAQLKQPSTMIMVTAGVLLLMPPLIPHCHQNMLRLVRPVCLKPLNCVTINAPACYRAATFVNVLVMALPRVSVIIFLETLVVSSCRICVGVEQLPKA